MFSRWRMVFVAALAVVGHPALALADSLLAQAASAREQAQQQKDAGDQFLKKGDQKGAEEVYRKAIELDPSWYVTHEALGNLQFSTGRYLEAVETFKKALAVEAGYVIGYYNVAFAYRKAKKFTEAVEYYRKYIERQAADPDAYYGLAASYEAIGQKKEAMQNYLLYAEKENRPSERQYVVKAKEKAEELRKSLGSGGPAPLASVTTAAAAAAPTAAAPPAAPAVRATTPAVSPSTPAASAPTATAPPAAPAPRATVPAVSPSTPAAAAPTASAPAAVTQPPISGKPVAMLLKEGDAAIKEKSYTVAMKAYFEAVKADPRNPEALFKLGLVYQLTDNLQAAALKWRTVLTIVPDHAGAKEALAKLESPSRPAAVARPSDSKTAETKPAQSKPALATPGITKPAESKAPETKPVGGTSPSASSPPGSSKTIAATGPKVAGSNERVAALVREGDDYFNQKSFSQAIVAYTHVTQLDPKNEEAMFKLGVAYAMSGNHKVAIFKWQQVLALNPKNESAKRNIERAQEKMKGKAAGDAPAPEKNKQQPGGASKAPETKPAQASSAAPVETFDALMVRAAQLKKDGNVSGVLETVDRALTIKTDDKALLLKGEALVLLKRYSEAKYVFAKVMALNPNLAAAIYGLGESCRLSGDQDRARYYFKMYVRSKAPDVSPFLVKKAQVFLAGK